MAWLRHSSVWAVLALVVLAASLRLWGAFADLPYIQHPDEPAYIARALHIFQTRDLNPHFFNYPSLFLYANALAYIPYYWVGRVAGVFQSPQDIATPIALIMGTAFAPLPSVAMVGRSVSILLGSASVALTYLVGQRLTGRPSVGLLAALMLAISPANVTHSRHITPDTYVVFWHLLTLLLSLYLLQPGRPWHYVLAGVLAGFSASSKYNGGLIIVCVVAAHFLRCGWRGFGDWKLYAALAASGLGFVLTTPFAVLDFPAFWRDMQFELQHYATGHDGMEGNALRWYLAYLWRFEGVAALLAGVQIFRGLARRSAVTALLAAFAVGYFAWISTYVVRNDRTILPLTPFLFILASILVVDLLRHSRVRGRQPSAAGWRLAAMVVVGCVCLLPWRPAVTTTLSLLVIDSRTTSRNWIETHLAPGSKIALESYSPFVRPDRFEVHSVIRLIDHTPDWYIDNDFDYLIASEGMFGRYFGNPDQYREEVASYEALGAAFVPVQEFNDGDYEIRIYGAAR